MALCSKGIDEEKIRALINPIEAALGLDATQPHSPSKRKKGEILLEVGTILDVKDRRQTIQGDWLEGVVKDLRESEVVPCQIKTIFVPQP